MGTLWYCLVEYVMLWNGMVCYEMVWYGILTSNLPEKSKSLSKQPISEVLPNIKQKQTENRLLASKKGKLGASLYGMTWVM